MKKVKLTREQKRALKLEKKAKKEEKKEEKVIVEPTKKETKTSLVSF